MDFLSLFDLTGVILPGSIAFVAIALLAIGINDWLPRRGRQLRAQGTVFEYIRNSSDKGDTYTPKVRFATADGRQIEFTDGFGVSQNSSPLGAAVPVIYSAENPERAFVPHRGKRFFTYLFLIGTLAILIVLWARQ
jgi:Protein of unknown function (DUF3592)